MKYTDNQNTLCLNFIKDNMGLMFKSPDQWRKFFGISTDSRVVSQILEASFQPISIGPGLFDSKLIYGVVSD